MFRQQLLALGLLLSLTLTNQGHCIDFWYSFDGDSGQVATDKLLTDGAQNGLLENNVSVTSSAIYGSQAALFEIPTADPFNPPFSTINVDGSTALGDSYTLSLFANNREETLGFTRLMSSFRGTGPVSSDRMLVDYDPTGSVIPGIRAIVNNTVVQTSSPPAGITDPGNHHYALTVDHGDVKIFFNGSEVASGNVGTGYSNSANILIGEDPHDGGGAANEQFIGSIDEFLAIGRALSPAEISQLAGAASVADVVTPAAAEYAVYYDFEGNFGDRFTSDAAHDGIPIQNTTLNTDASQAARGNGSASLQAAAGEPPFSRIAVGEVGNLGSVFTMSAAVNVPGSGYSNDGLTRLFTTFAGSGSASGRLIFDFDPNASVENIGLRVLLPNGAAAVANNTFSVDENHTLTAVYDHGDLKVYLDGTEVASASTSGDIDLGDFPLFIGEDNDARGLVNENLIGTVDDVFMISRALTPAEVMAVHEQGAAAVIPEPSSAALLLLAGLFLCRFRKK